MTRRFVYAALAGAMAVALAGSAGAQMNPSMHSDPKGYVPGTAPCSPGYWCDYAPTPTDGTVKSGVYNGTMGLAGNLCWRTGYWAPSMATIECDPDLVPKPPLPPPAAVPPPPPPPAPPPAPPGVQKITLASKALFDFDKSVLKPEGKAAIDSQILSKLAQVQKLELVLVTGHTDPIGTQQYNQKLSERRADAVRDYLVSKGVAKDKIETLGMGKTQPIPGLTCNQKNFKEKVECYAPDRRVEVEVKGEIMVRK